MTIRSGPDDGFNPAISFQSNGQDQLTRFCNYDKVWNMRVHIILISIIAGLISVSPAESFWVWTPETNKWINPKFSVKDTPKEQLEYGLSFLEAKDYKASITEFKKLIKHYPKAVEAPKAQFYIAQSLQEQGELFEAYKALQLILDKYPFSDLASDITERQYTIGLKMLDGRGSKGSFMDKILSTEDQNVLEVFRTVIKNAPYGPYAAQSQYKIAQYLQERKYYEEARDEFEKVINDYPGSEWAQAAQFQIALADSKRSAKAAYDQEITTAAVEEFQNFVAEHPKSELTDEALKQIASLREKEARNHFKVAQFYEKQKNFQAARIYYQLIVDDYPKSTLSSRALTKIREISNKE